MVDTVLVTGASGLIGRAMQAVIREKVKNYDVNMNWIFVSSKDADLTNYVQTKLMFQVHQPTAVIHLAAKVGGLFCNLDNNLSFFRENMMINDNVLRCAHEHNIKRVISCLSTCIFPDNTTYPLDENMIHLGPPHESNMGYAYAKRMLDMLSSLYNRQYGYCYTSIVPCNVFGPHDNFSLKNDTPLVVFGTGKPLRQYIYSLDLARLIIWALENYKDPTPIILATDEADEVTIEHVAKSIAQGMQFQGPIIFDTSKSDGQFKKTSSNAKMRSYLPDFKFTPFDKAIQETAEWFTANFDSARKCCNFRIHVGQFLLYSLIAISTHLFFYGILYDMESFLFGICAYQPENQIELVWFDLGDAFMIVGRHILRGKVEQLQRPIALVKQCSGDVSTSTHQDCLQHGIRWSLIFWKIVIGLLTGITLNHVYSVVGCQVEFFQTLALLELHWTCSFPYSYYRNSSIVEIIYPLADNALPWSISEIVRYSFYALNILAVTPKFLTWLRQLIRFFNSIFLLLTACSFRYTLFIGLYPLGVAGELLAIFAAMGPIGRRKLFTLEMPNIFNMSFNFYYSLFFIIPLYVPLLGSVDHLKPSASALEQISAVQKLLNRISFGLADFYVLEIDRSLSDNSEMVLVKSWKDVRNQTLIKGTSGVALAFGVNAHLRNMYDVHIAWDGIRVELPAIVSPPHKQMVFKSIGRYRYFGNVCTFSYSFAWWNWSRWEYFIDWMALNGINLPLAHVGNEVVWKSLENYFGLFHAYSADPFNEMVPNTFDVMVLQSWMFLSSERWLENENAKHFLTAVPTGSILVVDLYAEEYPLYEKFSGFYNQPFIWCMLHNFGGVQGLYGNLARINQKLADVSTVSNINMVGTGLSMEGIDQNYVVYQMALDRFWSPNNQKGVGITKSIYTAWGAFLQSSRTCQENEIYINDLVELTKHALMLTGAKLYEKLQASYIRKCGQEFLENAAAVEQVLSDLEWISKTHSRSMLSKWIEIARANGKTAAQSDQLEENLRMQVTIWGPQGEIVDYARKQWAALFSEYYLPRWRLFFAHLYADILQLETFNQTLLNSRLFHEIELPFALQKIPNIDQPTGNTVVVSKILYSRYRIIK
ncbi:GDP-L-fucose synthase [Trichinella spiralis]|uniref:GDP-4-keto-6-deoxy-D-mannose-3,5-epimerase-4-reductase n=1 Tax=Trichinella spiralis TaxID=6334 RepID=A0A0V1ARR9_TRISP|nr:GDP-L-fucose synthase [Trichinella spiralis]